MSQGIKALSVAALVGFTLVGCISRQPRATLPPATAPASQQAGAADRNATSRPVVPQARAKVQPDAKSGSAQPAAKPDDAGTSPYSVAAYRLKPSDPLVIFLRGILPRDDQIENVIDEDGYIKLPYLGAIMAAGLTTSQLENEIQRLYIDRQIYKHLTVNVVMPSQSYYVQGEVRNPGRFPMITGVTLLQAIAQAGGYTDFADRSDVRVNRAGQVNRYSAKEIEKHPESDIRIESGDIVIVTRSIL